MTDIKNEKVHKFFSTIAVSSSIALVTILLEFYCPYNPQLQSDWNILYVHAYRSTPLAETRVSPKAKTTFDRLS